MTLVPPAPPRPRERRRLGASASSVLRPLLTGPERTMVALAVFPGALHLGDPGSGRILLAVVANDAVVHPHALVIGASADDRHLGSLHRGRQVVVGGRKVALPDSDVEVARWWSPRPVLGPIDRVQLRGSSRSVAATIAERAATLPEGEAHRLRTLTDTLRLRDQAAAVAAAHGLLGLGAGSTPTGDDLLAGLFSGVRLLGSALGDPAAERVMRLADDVGRDVVAASDRATTAVSAALLRHAVRGEVCRPAGRLLVALAREPGGDVLSDAVDGLLAVGSGSGRDLAVGLLAAAELLIGDPVVSPAPALTSTILTGRA